MKTLTIKANEVQRQWFVVDADGQTVGRLATQIARVLMGKHKPEYSTNVNTGDFVVVVNADKVNFTGRKWIQKEYRHHSGDPGGLKSVSAGTMLKKHPERILETAVRGMLPKNRLRDVRMSYLKVYAQPDHPHVAQQPQQLPADL